MGLIQSFDPADIAATVAEEDRAAAARFRQVVSTRECELMATNAELRTRLSTMRAELDAATSLTYSYAKLIATDRTPQGIVGLIRRLNADRITVDELQAIIAALVIQADAMPHDTSLVAASLTEANDACASVLELPAAREVAYEEWQDAMRSERKDGVR